MTKEETVISDMPNGQTEPLENGHSKTNGTTSANGASHHQTNEGKDVEDIEEEETTSGCCGKSKPAKKSEAVGVLELFQFATCFDIILMVIGTIGAVGQGVTIPLNIAIFGEVIDVFLPDYSNSTTNSTDHEPLQEKVLPYIYYFIGIGVGSFICSFFAISCWTWAAERQVSTMRKKFFHSVMRQEIGWFDVHEAGEISSRFSEDVNKIAEGMGDKMAVFLQWVSTWAAAYVMAFTRSWKLTLVVAIFSPLLALAGALIVRVMRKMASKETAAYAKAGAIAEQALRSIRTVQAFQGQEKEVTKYQENLDTAVVVATKKGFALGIGNSLLWFLLFLMFAGVMWFGIYLVQEDDLLAGRILPVFFGVMIGSTALGNAFNNLESFSNARGAASKIFVIISMEPKIDSFSEMGLKLSSLAGNIEFKDIRFAYPARPEAVVLKKLNLTINAGQHVAFVGPSGCGKSTSVQLIQRFYDPLEGAVLVDGNDVKELNLKWLRSNIGVVSQEPSLFDASIEENIRFGRMDATEHDIHQAAKEANAHDFIMLLPEGYKTNVGERGAQLSGGQKQRISIARALVRNPKILLLDEATSALDQESEAVVQSALEKAQHGRTTITIAHRLSTVKRADKIVAISNGEVVEEGTHEELMKAQGLYYQLVKMQSKFDKESEIVQVEEAISLLSVRVKSPSPKDVSDVEIVEEADGDGEFGEEELLRSSFKKKINKQDSVIEKEINLVARNSFRKSKKKSKKGKDEKSGEDEIESIGMAKVMQFNAPEWQLIVLGCIGSIIAGGIHPAFSFLLSEFIKVFGVRDHAEQWRQTHVLAGIVIAAAVVSAVVRMLQGYCFSRSGALLTARLRGLTFASIINQDMDYFDLPNNQVGALATKLSGDAAMVQGATGSKIGQMLEAASTIVCALCIAFIFGWKLAFVVLSFMPLMIIGGVIQGKVIAGAAKKDKVQLQQAGKICSEVVDSIRTVVSLGREDYFVRTFDALIDFTRASSRKMSFVYGITYGVGNCIIFFAYAVAFYYGSVLVNDGEMEFFEVFRVFAAIIFGGMMIGRQSSFGADYTKAKIAGARIISIINRKPKIDVRETSGQKIANFSGCLQLENVNYFYPSRPNATVLNGLNLTINYGETVALVGASGCGKSTTAQLIERFYDVVQGALLVDGHDVKNLNLAWYRQQLGIVSQEPTLFDCSIAENIAYGDNSRIVPMAEIIEAAKKANIHTFISNLPQGYDTNVGEKGAQLSGGQKQRIAIARALVRNPKILLLDEATSALDSESEKVVQDALDIASRDRTCVTIAHRLSTIQNANKIAVFSKGKVIEIGNHHQLFAAKGAYYRLLMAQNRPHKTS
ncbi:ATP-dependent translocase ABCB1-like [Physella acuta]|uniref:ATP-dependent translocase ABCB1-like n=1 Tax=Physella acuta TaxID=109671 RepID=UPI0027DCDACC|nr:ATP-dependent translocase ABCB1-like [Physella acuta]